jgi:hypothetical protein
MFGGDGNDRFEFANAHNFNGATIGDFNTRAGDLDVADLRPFFGSLHAVQAHADVVKIDGVKSTEIHISGRSHDVDLVLVGYDIKTDNDLAGHFLV